ncbi:MAG: acetyl-CoA carboxylase biotin carboxyl carrier protein [Bacteroidia bacterium]|jgi:acetyl-CoA carboxylase biotin carboxyl carrier protein|nr:acetyl-CoA carboxylase biotin carboxyl carrier protein [Bacteroidota bacterium]MBP6513089.1 acetyl-CoA carboxylase biotin carboxyl carrier protein [Bacteroidia bacterium]MBP7245796.1 acetyl-CoA carboxylase biotin carboxyl carrier protein [Bacteroidia bacterium]
MNKKEIEELIKFVAKAGVSEVNLELKDFKITIKNSSPKVEQIYHAAPAPMPVAQMAAPAAATPAAPAAPAPVADDSKYITIKSPMIGTFYRASGPDKPVLANVGDEIKPGKVLCIIEAMKLFNEIESEISGRIVKVLVDNMKPVEYDTPLFLVDPS